MPRWEPMSGPNDRIRSALEIALEKAQRLGSLSDEEKGRLRVEELASAAEGLARRFLDGAPLKDIEADLAGRSEQEQPPVRSCLLSCLLDAIDVSSDSGNDRLLSAVERLSGDAEPARSIGGLLEDHRRALEKSRREAAGTLEAAKRRDLERLGISGSAVEPAIWASEEWVRAREDLDSRYRQRLDDIRRRHEADR
jgi:hypothetical protein